MTAIRIKSARVSKRGDRGLIIGVPKDLADELEIGPGDDVFYYKGFHGLEPVLVISKHTEPKLEL